MTLTADIESFEIESTGCGWLAVAPSCGGWWEFGPFPTEAELLIALADPDTDTTWSFVEDEDPV